MRRIAAVLRICIAGMISIGILSIFSLVYNYTGVHITNRDDKATDYVWEPNQLKTNLAEGCAFLSMDSRGYNNSYPVKKEDIDILVMGSSHMEALQVQADENVTYLLNEALEDKYAYNIGTSGHQIYYCMNNLQDAIETYAPGEYVLIETDEIKLSEERMQAVLNGTLDELQSYDDGILYYMQKYVPGAISIYRQVSSWIEVSRSGLVSNNSMTVFANEAEQEITQEYRKTLENFITKAQGLTKEHEVQLMLMYHPRIIVEADNTLRTNTEQQYLEIFAEVCEANDVIFIDMTEAFEKMYREDNRLPHGFFNTVMGEGHLNKYGHERIAQVLCEVIKEHEEGEQ